MSDATPLFQDLEFCHGYIEAQERSYNELWQEFMRLNIALRHYGQHERDCHRTQSKARWYTRCTCGFHDEIDKTDPYLNRQQSGGGSDA